MTTAIAVYNSDGCVGRCDARCHYASSPDCDCICGGRLHGTKGNAIAQNTVDLLGKDYAEFERRALDAFAGRNGHQASDLRVENAEQQKLFA